MQILFHNYIYLPSWSFEMNIYKNDALYVHTNYGTK